VEERVEPEIGVGADVEGSVSELRHALVEVLREEGDLGLGHPVDAHRAHEIVDASRGDAFDVGLADDRDERLLDSAARLEEAGQVAAFAKLRDVEADRAGTGVPPTFAVAIAAVLASIGPLAIGGVAQHVDVRVHQQLRCHLHHLSEQVRARRAFQVLAQKLGRAECVVDGHRIFSFVPSQGLKVGAVVVISWGCSARSVLLSASWSPRACTPLWRT